MKNKRLFALLTAALTGVSAAAIPGAFPAAPSEPACITAHAANGENPGTYHACTTNIGGYEIKYDYYDNSDGVTIYNVWGGPHGGGPLVIPQKLSNRNVTRIGSAAFNNKIVPSVTLPETVKEIGESAFEACTASSIILPSSLEKIDTYAFSRAHITSITIPAGVSVIEDSTFSGCDLLTSVTIEGAATIKQGAFTGCTGLTSITMREDCVAEGCDCTCLFEDSKEIDTINGYAIISDAVDENGLTYPVLDPHVRGVAQKFFWNCTGTKFIKEYSDRLCRYVVASETDPWMNDALKARQLHDWLIRHCTPNKVFAKKKNEMLYSAFFLSYGASENGVGKAVCSSYAKAYTMLLSAAGIESYVINDARYIGFAWNLVKIENDGAEQYYEVDVYNDDTPNAQYDYFLKSDSDMTALHKSYSFSELLDCADEHILLDQYAGSCAALKPQCNRSYLDANRDGILDYDFDLDGVYFTHDMADDVNAMQGFVGFAYGFDKSGDQLNDRLGDVLANLHALHMGYWDYVNNAAPHDVTVASGEAAEFKVTLFGENLTYQWMKYIPRTGTWDYIENASGIQPTLHIPAESCVNGAQYRCIINNQNGYCIWSYPVTLTVT
ncbi:MAG: leucine-rich repeat protein [Oscillospiraceae bacterium]|nr:leucine-rich repeat protein [Oscillospiraceae bacterium]